MADVLVSINILTEVSNVFSGVRCVDLCLQNEACVSVFYRRQNRRCQLHDVLFMSPQDGEQETGTVYYSVSTGDCPSGYVHSRLLNFLYQLHPEKILFGDGLADCKSRGEHFVVIDSEDKQNHLVKQITSSSDTTICSYFIDGSDAASEENWEFHDGRNMTFFSWAPDFPSDVTTKNYLVARRSDKFLWRHIESDVYMKGICDSGVRVTVCGLQSTGVSLLLVVLCAAVRGPHCTACWGSMWGRHGHGLETVINVELIYNDVRSLFLSACNFHQGHKNISPII